MRGHRTQWTPALDAFLREHYPHRPTREIAHMLDLPASRIYSRADTLGLCKSAAYMAQERQRANRALTEGGKRSRFVKGQKSWNKGQNFQAGGRSNETRFKPDRKPQESRNYRPIGSLRLSRDDYLERKITDDHPVPARRWEAVHRLVWEAARGPIPEGHAVVFRPGMKTAIESEVTLDRLELVTRAELMRRNSIHAHGHEIARLHQLRGAITRKIRNLFAELERLGDEDLCGEALAAEIQRAKAISGVAGSVIESAKVEVEFLRAVEADGGTGFIPIESGVPGGGAPRLVDGQRNRSCS